jgi:hypothetical protein
MGVLFAFFLQNNKQAKFFQWSSNLVVEKMEFAEVNKRDDTGIWSYEISTDEYNELVSLLKTVEKDTKKRKVEDASYNDYYLAFQYEQKTWILNCMTDGSMRVVFDTLETAEYYGYDKKSLFIDSPELWEYILNTVDSKASK